MEGAARCGFNGTTEQLAEKLASRNENKASGAKALIILRRYRHDQGRALIQKRLVRHFFRKL
jgi:hypothetical protein